MSRTATQDRTVRNPLKVVRADSVASDTESQQFVLELMALCQTLLYVAQKYTPAGPDAYVDAATVTHCGKQFQQLSGTATNDAANFVAPVNEINTRDMIYTSAEYRYLRNKSIAGFATIADLGAKNPAIGSADFLAGLRLGYRRASDIAISFLEDIYAAG